jgi:hypothetical protein
MTPQKLDFACNDIVKHSKRQNHPFILDFIDCFNKSGIKHLKNNFLGLELVIHLLYLRLRLCKAGLLGISLCKSLRPAI